MLWIASDYDELEAGFMGNADCLDDLLSLRLQKTPVNFAKQDDVYLSILEILLVNQFLVACNHDFEISSLGGAEELTVAKLLPAHLQGRMNFVPEE